MDTNEEIRFKRNRRYFDDFKHLWRVIPACHAGLSIEAHELDGSFVSAEVEPHMQWWIALSRDSCSEEIFEIPRIPGANLAAEIVQKIGLYCGFARALYLVSVDGKDPLNRKIVIHKPQIVQELFKRREISIIDVCLNRRVCKNAA